MSLSFLNTKSWHVTTIRNQKKLYEAEERERSRKKEEVRRAAILRKEKQLSDPSHASTLRNGALTGEGHSVSFMYQPPPGYVPAEPDSEAGAAELAAIRAREAESAVIDEMVENSEEMKNQGPRKHALPEILERQQKRLQQEQEAEAKRALHMDPNKPKHVKPLGVMNRDVKCVRCGNMGHESGDRECPMYEMNPNDISRNRREDPLTRILAKQGLDAKSKLKLIYTEDPVVGGVPVQSELNTFLADPELEQQRAQQAREIIAIGSSSDDSSESDTSSSDDGADELTHMEISFLESLTAEEMMILLKRYRREQKMATRMKWKEKMKALKLKRTVKIEGEEQGQEQEHTQEQEHHMKHEKKRKKKRRKGSHDDSSSSSTNSSSSDSDSRHRRRKQAAQTSSSTSSSLSSSSSSSTSTSTSTSSTSSSTSSSSSHPPAHPRARLRPRPVISSEPIDLTDDG